MSEPQARSTLGTCWRTLGAILPIRATLVFSLLVASATAGAQIHGRPPSMRSTSTWWLSAGAGATTITDINDGATRSTWRFGSDPVWQVRGSLERGLDEFTTIGVAAAYGKVDLMVVPLVGATGSMPLPATCVTGCAARSQLWALMGQFRSGGGPSFHTLLEASAGVSNVRNLRTTDASPVAIGKPSGTMDLSGTLGPGFGYGLSRRMAIALVQDFGIGWHAKTDLPSGTSRTWRVRSTRASLRFSF